MTLDNLLPFFDFSNLYKNVLLDKTTIICAYVLHQSHLDSFQPWPEEEFLNFLYFVSNPIELSFYKITLATVSIEQILEATSHKNSSSTATDHLSQKVMVPTLRTIINSSWKFTYLRSSVSSTEKDIDTRLTKAWTAINRLSIIWKSDLTDKWNAVFSRQQSYRYCCMDALHGRW